MNKIEAALSYFNDRDVHINKKTNTSQFNQEFKNILLADLEKNHKILLDKDKQSYIFDEVDKLSSEIEVKKPDLKDLDKLTTLDQLFHSKFSVDKLRSNNDISSV